MHHPSPGMTTITAGTLVTYDVVGAGHFDLGRWDTAQERFGAVTVLRVWACWWGHGGPPPLTTFARADPADRLVRCAVGNAADSSAMRWPT